MPDKKAQWQKLFDYMLGYQAVWVIDVGLKSGLLQAIADHEPVSESHLADQLALDPRYLAVWCRAAYAFEIVDWDAAAGYRLAPHLRELLLDPADPRFLGGRLQFYAALYQDFHAFPSYLKSGGSWARSEHDPWLLEALGNMTKPDAAMILGAVLPQAPATLARLERGGHILDVGAGAGYAVIQYAHRFPHARVVGIESEAAMVELGQKALAGAGLSNAALRHGDANQLADRDTYDLVTMNVALHETGGPAEWHNVLRRIHASLKPGGTLIVSELPYPDAITAYREQPVYKALAGVQFHETLVGCGAITQHTLRDLLVAAGFPNARVADQPVATRFVMLAEK